MRKNKDRRAAEGLRGGLWSLWGTFFERLILPGRNRIGTAFSRRLRLLTKCGVQGDHPPAGVWGRAPKPYAAAFFVSVASVRRREGKRVPCGHLPPEVAKRPGVHRREASALWAVARSAKRPVGVSKYKGCARPARRTPIFAKGREARMIEQPGGKKRGSFQNQGFFNGLSRGADETRAPAAFLSIRKSPSPVPCSLSQAPRRDIAFRTRRIARIRSHDG